MVDKITSPISALDLIDKTNEIIDALNDFIVMTVTDYTQEAGE